MIFSFIRLLVVSINGKVPKIKAYKMHPIDHISIEELAFGDFLRKSSGAMYFKVPAERVSKFELIHRDAIPKSTICIKKY